MDLFSVNEQKASGKSTLQEFLPFPPVKRSDPGVHKQVPISLFPNVANSCDPSGHL